MTDDPQPAGGCVLIEKAYAARGRDAFAHVGRENVDVEAFRLLRVGRHFRLSDRAKAIVVIGAERFVISEITGSDPVTFEAWRALPMDEFEGECHEDGSNLDHLRVRLPDQDDLPGAAFVLLGPPLRLIVQPEDEGEGDRED